MRLWRGLRLGGDGVKQGAERLSMGVLRQDVGGVTHWEGEGELDSVLVELSSRGGSKFNSLVQSSLLSCSSLSSTSEVCSGAGVSGLAVSAQETDTSSELVGSDCPDATTVLLSVDWLLSSLSDDCEL